MRFRLGLFKGATALLYLGPLVAGLAGFSWGVVAIFVLIFWLWLYIQRPWSWRQNLQDLWQSEALVALSGEGVTQALLVAASFGIGRGLGGMLGAEPQLPLMLPVAISFLAIPLTRMIWPAWQPGTAKTLLAQSPPPPADNRQSEAQVAARMVAELRNLPAGSDDALLQEHLAAMATQVGPEMLRMALMDPVYDGTASALHLRAAVLHATDGATVDALAGSAYAMALFRLLNEAGLLVLFAQRCTALLAEDITRLPDCPDPEAVLAMAERVPAAAKALAVFGRALGAARSE